MQEYKLKSFSGKEIAFTTEVTGQDRKLIVCSFGPDFSGKSRFLCTGPVKGKQLIGIVPTDRKTRLTVQQAMDELKRHGKILLPKQDLVREVNPSKMSWAANPNVTDKEAEEKTKVHYRAHVDKVKEVTWALHAHPDVSLICIDLFQQFYQDMKYAHYGRKQFALKKVTKDYYQDTHEADQEIIDFINSISDKHLILTHKSKPEYENDKATGRMTWEGFKFMGNHVNVVVEHHNNKKFDPKKENDPDTNWHYAMSIRRAQWNAAEVEGEAGEKILKDEWITFQMLGMALFPNSDPEDWA
jgi:hypothetical protein